MSYYDVELTKEDWLLIGYCLGIVIWYVADHLSEDDRSWTEQTVVLEEEHLARIEDGGSVAVPRWHGVELRLGGDLVVDADELEG